jgi:hypothetical protein
MPARLGTAALLVALWLWILGGWWLVLRLIDPLLERGRVGVIRSGPRQIARQRRRVVDLVGQVCWLLPESFGNPLGGGSSDDGQGASRRKGAPDRSATVE